MNVAKEQLTNVYCFQLISLLSTSTKQNLHEIKASKIHNKTVYHIELCTYIQLYIQ